LIKRGFVILFSIIIIIAVFSLSSYAAGLPDIMSSVQKRTAEYDSGKTDIAQMLVMIEHDVKKVYSELERNTPDKHLDGFSESDFDSAFGKKDNVFFYTKDFGVMLENYNGGEGNTLLINIVPSNKKIDIAIDEARNDYVNKMMNDTASKNADLDAKADKKQSEIDAIQKKIDSDDELPAIMNDTTALDDQIKILIDEKNNLLDQKKEKGDFHPDDDVIDAESIRCKNRFEETLKIRKLFEKALPDFPSWYFKLLRSDLDTYFNAASGAEFMMLKVMENGRSLKEDMKCFGKEDWSGVSKITINHEKETEEFFKVWEEENVKGYWTTYYQYYFMPSKTMMREIIQKKIDNPSVSSSSGQGANEKIKSIKKLADSYDGSFDVQIRIYDSDKDLLNKQVTINPTVILSSKSVHGNQTKMDLDLEIDYDIMYEFMRYSIIDLEGDDVHKPDWVEKSVSSSNAWETFGVISKGFSTWIKGVKVRPIYEVPKLLLNLRNIIEIFGD